MKRKVKTNPPGRVKIMKALSALMIKRDFHSITTAEIAATAEVAEALIYKYFKDKKDLLHQVLSELFAEFNAVLESEIYAAEGSVTKLRILIHKSLEHYAANRVFAKILFLEVRSSPRFFESDAYESVKVYAREILKIINAGIETGELRRGVDPITLRKVILGSIEHACLGEVIFGRELDIEAVTDQIVDIVFEGAKA